MRLGRGVTPRGSRGRIEESDDERTGDVVIDPKTRELLREELKKVDVELTEVLTAIAEAEFLVAYLGEQPEVVELRARKPEAEKLERRRQYLGMIIERLDQVIPQQPAVTAPVPNAGGKSGGGLRRF